MRRAGTALAATLVATLWVGGAAAQATTAAAVSVVSTDPASFTPRVVANTAGSKTAVYKTAELGAGLFVGGEFTQIQDAARTRTYDRKNLFSFNRTTGAVSPLSVDFSGPVWAITSDGTSLYVGGTFSSVNGLARRGIVKLNPVTGAVDPRFDAHLDGVVREAEVVGGRLIIGGEFSKKLQAVDLDTGADTGYLDLHITGDVDGPGGWVPRVYRFDVDSTGTRLAAVGNFTTVDGALHPRAVLVDLGPTSGTVDPWRYLPLRRSCTAEGLREYLRDAAFAPDGSWFVLVATGGVPKETSQIGTSICDAAARFETAEPAPRAPTWINYTGGDTLQSAVVGADAVYVQGHNRWLDNPFGNNSCGAGCVSRPGIGAIDPVSGLALRWNPTKDRGEGGKDLLLTGQGLWVSSDTEHIGGEVHERLALMPAA